MNAISIALAALSSASAITATVNNRIYLNEIGQSEPMPQITLNDVSDNPINDLTAEATTKNERIQVDVFSSKYSECADITTDIIAALETGGVSFVRLGTQKVKDLETQLYRFITDFSIWY